MQRFLVMLNRNSLLVEEFSQVSTVGGVKLEKIILIVLTLRLPLSGDLAIHFCNMALVSRGPGQCTTRSAAPLAGGLARTLHALWTRYLDVRLYEQALCLKILILFYDIYGFGITRIYIKIQPFDCQTKFFETVIWCQINFSVSHPWCQITFLVSHSWCQIKFDRRLFRRPTTV